MAIGPYVGIASHFARRPEELRLGFGALRSIARDQRLTPVPLCFCAGIGSGFETKTITLSCGKLTTGVTVPQWSSILMLRDLKSPETYFQAAPEAATK
jgi:hypothetical protein